ELLELELLDLRKVDDVEKLVNGLIGIEKKYPNERRIGDRVVAMAFGPVPPPRALTDQLSAQQSRVQQRLRKLPNDQVNWPTVHRVLRDLRREFQRLRKVAGL